MTNKTDFPAHRIALYLSRSELYAYKSRRIGIIKGTPMQSDDEFAQAVRERLPKIDRILADQNMALGVRPLNAAIHFVEYFVLDIEGGTKDQFWDQEWFAILFWHVGNWYADWYGEHMESSEQRLPAIVLINGTPFKLNIAVTRSEVEESGQSSWLIGLARVH